MRTFVTAVVTGLRRSAFVFVVAAVAAVGSERMFWYWSTDLGSQLFVALFYSIPVGVTLWAIDRYGVSSLWALWLATPLYALITEGVITPVVYSGGPLVPIFPAWFAFWHGMLAFGGLIIGLRFLILAGRTTAVAAASLGLGVFWGLWSTTLWLPENVEDPELIADQGSALQILDPGEFAAYAALFTGLVLVGHGLFSWLWPASFRPARWTIRLWCVLVLIVVAAWSAVVPWAFPMFLAYAWLHRWGLRRHERIAEGPNLLEQLAGPTPRRPLVAVATMAPAAAITYTACWQLEVPLEAVRAFMWSMIAAQTIAGFVISVMALRRAGRSSTTERLTDPLASTLAQT
ncbi:MAG: hypothetical protein AAGA37_21330 [Actinomycetota bacterium]